MEGFNPITIYYKGIDGIVSSYMKKIEGDLVILESNHSINLNHCFFTEEQCKIYYDFYHNPIIIDKIKIKNKLENIINDLI